MFRVIGVSRTKVGVSRPSYRDRLFALTSFKGLVPNSTVRSNIDNELINEHEDLRVVCKLAVKLVFLHLTYIDLSSFVLHVD